jgi:uncharacterized membrane protein YjgN (DUF898 family)
MAATAAPAQGRSIRPEFTGAAGEYFRIWIVNLFFTLVTLGIYSAWAKVRKKKYFYGSTRLDGDSFDYFANPRAIFKGRIVAVAVLVIYAFCVELYPASRLAFWAVAAGLLPWLIVRAFTFNARNSAWRGVRFDFTATARDAAWVYVGKLAVAVISLGLAYPWFMARQKAFVVAHHALGTTTFECQISARKFLSIYFVSGLIISAIGGLIALATAIALPLIEPAESLSWAGWALPVIAFYAGYAVAYAYIQARTTNLLWKGTIGPGMRFESSLAATRLAGLYLGNVFAVACSAGLLIPWAVIRTLRYRLENLTVIIDEDMEHQANPALTPVGAAGQELGDIFNLDLGL